MPRALVTGATGMLGSHVAERLRDDGWDVRALVRDPDAARPLLATLGAEPVRGDVLDARSMREAARGCDVVFHAAAAITPHGGWERFRTVNVEGTTNVVAAARDAGARLMHVSSVATYGMEARYDADGPVNEAFALRPLPPHDHYGRSKRESEAVALDAHRRGELWATAIRPAVIYGRRDRQFVPRLARLARTGIALLPDGGRATLAAVHAANVADAAVLAARTDAAGGEAFNVANDFDVTVAEFFRLASIGLGRPIRIVPVPGALAQAGVTVLRPLLGMVGKSGVGAMLRGTLQFATSDNPFTSARARRELGWAPRVRPEDGVPDAFRWWNAQRARDARTPSPEQQP